MILGLAATYLVRYRRIVVLRIDCRPTDCPLTDRGSLSHLLQRFPHRALNQYRPRHQSLRAVAGESLS